MASKIININVPISIELYDLCCKEEGKVPNGERRYRIISMHFYVYYGSIPHVKAKVSPNVRFAWKFEYLEIPEDNAIYELRSFADGDMAADMAFSPSIIDDISCQVARNALKLLSNMKADYCIYKKSDLIADADVNALIREKA